MFGAFFDYLILMVFYFLFLQNPPDWQEILTYFRGSELQNFFTRILEDNLKVPFDFDAHNLSLPYNMQRYICLTNL